MHWSTSDVMRSPLYSSTMSRNRFTAILRFLHLANNQAEDKFSPDKLFKVRPLLDIVLPSFLRIYKPGRNLSPDETMVKFNGRIGFKQYMPRKAAKCGVSWPSGLAYRTQVLVLAAECGFESRPWHLCPWARHLTIIASLHPGVKWVHVRAELVD